MTYWNPLVPELTVTCVENSLKFYLAAGFEVRFKRTSPDFAYIESGGAQLMLEQDNPKNWKTAELSKPYGRGVNFQIEVPSAHAVLDSLNKAGIPLFQEIEESWYEISAVTEEGQIEFLVKDPDGYLLRFVEPLGSRPK